MKSLLDLLWGNTQPPDDEQNEHPEDENELNRTMTEKCMVAMCDGVELKSGCGCGIAQALIQVC